MKHNIKSIRSFIGAKDFEESKTFYRILGFEEAYSSEKLSYFKNGDFGFYLQDAYVKDWIDNSMIFLEVNSVDEYWTKLQALNLTKRFKNVRLTEIKHYEWGKECFIHDPSGILWHFGEFI